MFLRIMSSAVWHFVSCFQNTIYRIFVRYEIENKSKYVHVYTYMKKAHKHSFIILNFPTNFLTDIAPLKTPSSNCILIALEKCNNSERK